MRSVRSMVALCALTLIGGAAASNADTIGVQVSGGHEFTEGAYTLGYTFSTSTEVYVTQLGILDYNTTPLLFDSTVSIWNSTGDLLVSKTFLAGSTGTIADTNEPGSSFELANVSATTLASGQTYTIGEWSNVLPGIFQGTPITASGISYGSYVYTQSNGEPTSSYPPQNAAYFGPVFGMSYTPPPPPPAATPEPGSIALVISGAATIGFSALRRRRKFSAITTK